MVAARFVMVYERARKGGKLRGELSANAAELRAVDHDDGRLIRRPYLRRETWTEECRVRSDLSTLERTRRQKLNLFPYAS